MFFNKPILKFLFYFSLRIYILPWPASFSWLIKHFATKYGLILFNAEDFGIHNAVKYSSK